MVFLVRGSTLKEGLVVVSCMLPVCLRALPALAQHPAERSGGGVVHTAAPPILHFPISPAPTIRAPLLYAPVSAPRASVAPSAGALTTTGFRPPRRPIRPFPPVLVVYQPPFVFGEPFWGLNCWWVACDLFWPSTISYTTASSPGPINYSSQSYETPVYVYGVETPDLPQLFLIDGTILNVTDYWLVDGQMHFTMIEENSTQPAGHMISFDALDWQTTVDANTRRGFRVMLRNEPFEHYVRDHPESPPPVVTPPL
jgi:hypothetical protein